jgi:hypothetical protein
MGLFLIEVAAGWMIAVVAIVRWFSVVSRARENEPAQAVHPLLGRLSSVVGTTP